MALELLQGPTLIRHERYPDGPTQILFDTQWLEGVGLAAYKLNVTPPSGVSSDGHTCIIQLDGWARIRNDNPSGVAGIGYLLDLQGGELISRTPFSDYYYHRFSKVTLSFLEYASPLGNRDGTRYAFLPDRPIYVEGQGLRSRPYANIGHSSPSSDPEAVLEAAFTPSIPGGSVFKNFSRGPGGTVYIAFSNGWLYQYDYLKRAFIPPRKGLGVGCDACHYLPELGIFLSLHKDTSTSPRPQDYLQLWADEIRPENLTAPTALTPLTRGQVSTVEVQLTGSLSEPVAGFPIDWDLVGEGSLIRTQSRTDSEGKARVGYRAPIDSTPTVTISAEAVF